LAALLAGAGSDLHWGNDWDEKIEPQPPAQDSARSVTRAAPLQLQSYALIMPTGSLV
jgi:hypothetical protein